MSIARIALRTAAVEAIKGRTLVGDNVLDSPNGALDIAADGTLRTNEDRPFVAVFTDDAVAEGIEGRNLTANGTCVLVIEAGVSIAMTQTNDKGESEIVGIGVPASDRHFEFLLEFVQRQVNDALTDPDNDWAEIWRSLSLRVVKIEVGAKRTSDDGQRLAGRQTRIWLDLLPDPVLGDVLEPASPFTAFLDRLAESEDQDNQKIAGTLRTIFDGPVAPDWHITQRRLGATRDELRAIGLGPIKQDTDRATPVLAEVEGMPEPIVVLAP
ncbi:hypothetical protein [Aureimonas phyllosphaerae]|uniref:Uncharacterized protein n=1 Tax=Aureimonas phyllosphaerae TaxID=1166078 RepID=A0A7W6C1U3_9HYPH|nr:hypothetical protein [Aureimonas phyllosphaerae]MBB3937931.1 hypothetical protein [Aureimonas phyllosphaerae]MBB3961896.1 hypothetical protein [Aureimonas phyllosphaerae]SFF54519.1 hypothetical protein SAMN05216566_12524 [Aureimonas phyllosphaerae]